MRTFSITLSSLLLSVLFVLSSASSAQTGTSSSFDRTLSWSITINGIVPQALQVPEEASRDASQKFLLNAISAFTKGEIVMINAEIIPTTKGQMLVLSPATGNRMVTLQNQDGNFEGTLTSPKGQVLGIKIRKLSEKELAEIKSLRDKDPVIETVASDVPAACARFAGGWAGDWSFGKRWLWITGVDTKCVAKYSYDPQRPKNFKSAEIKDGELSIPCGANNGTCYFTYHGDELWARYAGDDGTNHTVFKKIAPTGG